MKEPESPKRWVILKVERKEDLLRLEAEDDRGRKRSATAQPGERFVRGERRVLKFHLPAEIEELMTGGPGLEVYVELSPHLREEVHDVEPELSPELAERVKLKEWKGSWLLSWGGEGDAKISLRDVRKKPIEASGGSYDVVMPPPARTKWDDLEEEEEAGAPSRKGSELHPQERRVDVALLSVDKESLKVMPQDSSLRRNGLYRLRVHVGQRQEGSLMTGKVPPLDPLLPASPSGHTLHVVVFEKDFQVITPRVRPLFLPKQGASKPVRFDIRAPDQTGPARLRLKVYHENQLLQSFVLEAEVAEEEELAKSPEPLLHVDLAYTRTARFANLGDFKPRALSIGVNQDADGSHLFQFKVGNAADAVKLSEEILETQMERFRRILERATLDANKGARFPTYPEPGTPPSEEFFQVIRELAEAGHELHRALFGRLNGDLKNRLRAVAASGKGTLQFVRDDPNFVFPWTVIYDFGLPARIAGAEPLPVCLGVDPVDPARRCSHKSGDKVYCINGFWGIRHILEILLARAGELEDEVQVVERPAREAAVCLAFEPGDEFASEMAAKLATELGPAVRVVDEGEDLLDLLWDPERRPALLILLGHLETKTIDGEPEGPRIVLVPNKKWFQSDPVSNREFDDGSWNQPRSVVLLMACGSATTEVSTLNDFMMAVSGAGAGAVVGTECLVFSRLVSRFAREVAMDLWQGTATLGESIQGFRRRLVADGNPLGFVFTATGNADLMLKLQG